MGGASLPNLSNCTGISQSQGWNLRRLNLKGPKSMNDAERH